MAVARPEEPKQHVIKVNRALYARLLSVSASNNNCPIPNALDKLIEELQAKPPVVKTVEKVVEKPVVKEKIVKEENVEALREYKQAFIKVLKNIQEDIPSGEVSHEDCIDALNKIDDYVERSIAWAQKLRPMP